MKFIVICCTILIKYAKKILIYFGVYVCLAPLISILQKKLKCEIITIIKSHRFLCKRFSIIILNWQQIRLIYLKLLLRPWRRWQKSFYKLHFLLMIKDYFKLP